MHVKIVSHDANKSQSASNIMQYLDKENENEKLKNELPNGNLVGKLVTLKYLETANPAPKASVSSIKTSKFSKCSLYFV